MLIPYCKLEDNCVTRWTYIDIIQLEHKKIYEYAYCSLFRNEYAIFGEYVGEPINQEIRYGILDKNLNVIVPPIYSSLEFYPNSHYCLLGHFDVKINFQSKTFNSDVIFNLKDNFSLVGKEIIPIYDNLFLLINAPTDLKLYCIDGVLKSVIPFSIIKQISKTTKSELAFEKIEYCKDYFRIRYWTNGSNRTASGLNDDFDDYEYWEQDYWIFYNFKGELLGESENKDEFTQEFMLSGWRNSFEDLKWLPENVEAINLKSIYDELLDKNILKSKERFPFNLSHTFVFQTLNGESLWEPSLTQKILDTSVWDKINFGQFKGERYIDIFKYNPNYIEWIVKKTEIVFDELSNFLINGNPKKLVSESLSLENKEKLLNHIKSNNIISKNGNYMLTLKNFRDLNDLGILEEQNFKEYYYRFNDDLLGINENKNNKA